MFEIILAILQCNGNPLILMFQIDTAETYVGVTKFKDFIVLILAALFDR